MKIRNGIKLPKEYQQVEYIESSGTQWINTGVIQHLDTGKIYIKAETCQLNDTTVGTYNFGNAYTQCGFKNNGIMTTKKLVEVTWDSSSKKEIILVDGVQKVNTTWYSGWDNIVLYLFNLGKNSTEAYYRSTANFRYWSCKIYENDELTRNFIPCYRKSDNAIGMYDTINNVFYTNVGTGTFLKGNNVTSACSIKSISFPSMYQEVEYIQSSGTQYIDTGYIPKVNNITLDLDMAWTGSTVGAFETFMGFMKSTTENNPRMGLHKYSSKFMFGANSTTTSGTTPVSGTRVHLVGKFVSGNQQLFLNDSFLINNTTTFDFSSNTCPVYIFARYCPNSMNYASMRLYRAKIYEGTTLKMDFIPCYRRSDSVIGLYDTVTKTFFTNQGSGNFTKGSNKSLPEFIQNFLPRTTLLPPAYQQVEYLAGVNGNQYINTAYIPSYTKGFNIEFGFNPTVSGRRYCLLSNYNTGNQQLSLELAADNKVRLWMNNGSNDKKMTQTFTINAYNKINYIYKSGTWKMVMTNGSGTYTDTGSYSVTGASTTTMRMFVDNATRTTTFNTPLKIYYCKIYEEDILIHYYVPCYRKSDTAIGIYDVVTKSFLTNNGSGTFTKGNNSVTII